MNEGNEVVLDAIKRLSPEHRQRAESIAVVVEQALASAQNTIAELQKHVAELEAFVKCPIGLDEASDICSAGTCRICLSKLRQTFDAERQRRESAEAAIQAITQSDAGLIEAAEWLMERADIIGGLSARSYREAASALRFRAVNRSRK